MARRRPPRKIEFNEPGGEFVEAALDGLRPGWRARAEANRSWWKPIEVLLGIGLWLALWAWTWRFGLWFVHTAVHHEKSFPDFYQHGVTAYFSFAAFVLAIPLFCVAGILVNALVGLIPRLKRVSERGSDKFPELTLRRSSRDLARVCLKMSLLALPVALIAAAAPF